MFCKAGVLESNITVVARDEQDPFLAAGECETLEDLISTTMSSHEACAVGDYINGEGSPVCDGLDDSNWAVLSLHQSVRRRSQKKKMMIKVKKL